MSRPVLSLFKNPRLSKNLNRRLLPKHAAKPQKSGVVILLKKRILSLAVVLMIGFVLLVSLLLNVSLRAVIANPVDTT